MTKVKFYRDETGEVFAFFPDEYFNLDMDPDLFTSYTHIGQHSACSLEYTKSLKPATRLEFEPLLQEFA